MGVNTGNSEEKRPEQIEISGGFPALNVKYSPPKRNLMHIIKAFWTK